MTMLKASALALGIAGAFALGVLTGPSIRTLGVADQGSPVATTAITATTPSAVADASPARAPRVAASAPTSRVAKPITPDLQNQLKPLLNKGTDMRMAAEGFRDAEQFAAVAHAAKNTGAPFVVLKHHVLEEGRSLRGAIQLAAPDLNAAREASRALSAARADLPR